MKDFDSGAEKLQAWLDERGCLPWDKSADKEERELASWVAKVRIARRRGCLEEADISLLDSLDEWDWGDDESDDNGAANSDPDSTSKNAEQNADAATATGSHANADSSGRTNEEIMALEQWRQLTTQRLATELARQPDESARRAKLRHWQRAYHPDKNPGRSDEVLPIFRWVQDCWDRDFRGAELPQPPPTAGAEKRSRKSKAAPPQTAHEQRAPEKHPAEEGADGKAEAKPEPRRRLTGKRKL